MTMLDDELLDIDSETVSILFRNQQLYAGKRSSGWEDYLSRSSEPKRLLDESFYLPLYRLTREPMPWPQKTTRNMTFKRRKKYGGTIEYSVNVPLNNFGMASEGTMGGTMMDFKTGILESKIERILRLYEHAWVTPLQRPSEIRRKQAQLRHIVENKDYALLLEQLATSLNGMLVPHLHLSSLSKLLFSNVMGSSRSGAIHQQDQEAFFQDYLRMCAEFLRGYNQATHTLETIDAQPSPSPSLPSMIKTALGQRPLSDSYRVGREILESSPASFSELKSLLLKKNPSFTQEYVDSMALNWLKKDHKDAERMRQVLNQANYLGLEVKKLTERKFVDLYLLSESWRRFTYFSNPPIFTVPWLFASSDGDISSVSSLTDHLVVALAQAEYFRNHHGWSIPTILPKSEGIIDIRNGWYPLTPLWKGESPIKNNTQLDPHHRVEILDGTNRGGKTIDMKKTAFAVVCAMAGNYVPAEQGTRISYFDKVYFRLKGSGLNDRSALEQELTATGSVLTHLTNGSAVLVCIDEPWSSTNAKEGEALTYGLVRRISEMPTARGIFAIHYPQLRHHSMGIEGVAHAHFEYQEGEGKIITAHQKLPGPNPQPGYAFAIAMAEGLHSQVLAESMRLCKVNTHGK